MLLYSITSQYSQNLRGKKRFLVMQHLFFLYNTSATSDLTFWKHSHIFHIATLKENGKNSKYSCRLLECTLAHALIQTYEVYKNNLQSFWLAVELSLSFLYTIKRQSAHALWDLSACFISKPKSAFLSVNRSISRRIDNWLI